MRVKTSYFDQQGIVMLEMLIASTLGSLLLAALLHLVFMQYRLIYPLQQQWLMRRDLLQVFTVLSEELQRSGFNAQQGQHLTFSDSEQPWVIGNSSLGLVYRMANEGEQTLRHIVYRLDWQSSHHRLLVCEKHSATPLSFQQAGQSVIGSVCYSVFEDHIHVEHFSVTAIDTTAVEIQIQIQHQNHRHLKVEQRLYSHSRNHF